MARRAQLEKGQLYMWTRGTLAQIRGREDTQNKLAKRNIEPSPNDRGRGTQARSSTKREHTERSA
eukprot:IDg11109t1